MPYTTHPFARVAQFMSAITQPPDQTDPASLLYDPAVRKCLEDIEAAAGYKLPAQWKAPFMRFHAFVSSNPPPPYIAAWKSSDPSRRYIRHVSGVLTDTQNAVTCVLYHRDNLFAIENAVHEIFTHCGLQKMMGNHTIGIGNTIRWDAEYQAFVLAVRRSLDYLTRALAAYFLSDHHSFNSFPKALSRAKPIAVASALAEAHRRNHAKFDYVLSHGDRKSTRDLLSHYEYISAGTLNLSRHGFLMFGGGEHLGMAAGPWEGGLSAVIRKRADDLNECISDMLLSFVTAADANR